MSKRLAPGQPVRIVSFRVSANITSTTDPLLRMYTEDGLRPVEFRITPLTEFDRTTEDETYVLSVEDDGTKISTDNAALTTANKAKVLACSFDKDKHVAAGSYVELIVTLGGTTPIIPAGSLVEFEYIAG